MIGLWLALTLGARAGVALDTPPTVGVETVVEVVDDDGRPSPGETVRVVHRPGLAGQRELAIGITDGRGRVRWTPELPGVATLRAGEELSDVAIAPTEPQAPVLVLLGLLAVAGGAALGYGLLPGLRPR